eukprot:Seg542.3 transcript_id=Seg542.3/GoldUCD/mRNA.D3Y31 product="hypothetical protein" protein_id=Seg542.3/GoldUCD/D3Y31
MAPFYESFLAYCNFTDQRTINVSACIRWSDNYRSGLATTESHSNAFVVAKMADEDEGESANDPSKIKITSCFLHFEGIKDCSSEITKQRIEKFLSCRRRWADLKGKEGDVARKSYELFEDKLLEDYLSSHAEFQFRWPYYKACYKKFCDVEKISRAEEKIAKDGSFQVIEGDAGDDGSAAGLCADQAKDYVPEKKMTRLSIVRENGSRADTLSKRNRYVLPARCIICHKDSAWFGKKNQVYTN